MNIFIHIAQLSISIFSHIYNISRSGGVEVELLDHKVCICLALVWNAQTVTTKRVVLMGGVLVLLCLPSVFLFLILCPKSFWFSWLEPGWFSRWKAQKLMEEWGDRETEIETETERENKITVLTSSVISLLHHHERGAPFFYSHSSCQTAPLPLVVLTPCFFVAFFVSPSDNCSC